MKIQATFLALLLAAGLGAQTKYTNPVYNWDTPDPSIQRGTNGTFYCYATACQVRNSSDLVHWSDVKDVFSRPTWNDTTYIKNGEKHTDYYSLWASDVNLIGNKYVMYYASALWGNGSRTGIGVATANTPTKFTDVGRLFRSTEIKVENSIDPCYIEEGDKKYLAWGSFNGIYITELTDDGLAVKDWKNITRIAGTAFEGALIHKHGDYYYLFASTGSCCEGVNSTYETVVGRSTSLMGPYKNKNGARMLDNNRTIIITSNSRWKGPGHNSEIITDDEGQDWIMYHAYDYKDPDRGRVLMLDRLKWDAKGWPYVEGRSPSTTEQDGPVFYKTTGQNVNYKLQNTDFMKSKFQGWTFEGDGNEEAASGEGTVFFPLMHVRGGSFTLDQTRSSFADGIYEMQVSCHCSGGHIRGYVNSVDAPLQNCEAESCTHAETADAAGKLLKKDDYRQHFYGLVVGGKLSIGFRADGLETDKQFWAANVQVIRRDADETAIAAVRSWYERRAALAMEDEEATDYYKTRLQAYLKALEDATTIAEQRTALINIHKTLNSMKALEPGYDGVDAVVAPSPLREASYDLTGRLIPANRRHHGIAITAGRKHL